MGGDDVEIVVSNKASSPLYEQIATQIKAAIMSGELKAGEAIPSVRALAKSLHISILTVQKAYATLQEDGFIETTAGKGCYVSAQNQDFYLEEQQKKIEEKFSEAVGIARTSGINLDKLISLLTCTRFYGAKEVYSFRVDARELRSDEKQELSKVKTNKNYEKIEKRMKEGDTNEEA